jgi:hypothetical protein
LIKDEYFEMFTISEFDIFVSGKEIYDWKALKSATQCADGYSNTSQTVVGFWEIFDQMNPTGSSRASVGGLANVKLIIQKQTTLISFQLLMLALIFSLFLIIKTEK